MITFMWCFLIFMTVAVDLYVCAVFRWLISDFIDDIKHKRKIKKMEKEKEAFNALPTWERCAIVRKRRLEHESSVYNPKNHK